MRTAYIALTSFILLGVVDGLLTYIGVSLFGLSEGNLLMRSVIERGWLYFFAIKIAVYGALARASLLILPRVAPVVLTAIGAGVVAYNSALILSSL